VIASSYESDHILGDSVNNRFYHTITVWQRNFTIHDFTHEFRPLLALYTIKLLVSWSVAIVCIINSIYEVVEE